MWIRPAVWHVPGDRDRGGETIEQRVYATNAALFVLVEVGIGVFDASLELGRLRGAVFVLWTLYAGAAFLLVNGLLAGAMAFRDGPAKPFVISGLAVPVAAAALAAVAATILQ